MSVRILTIRLMEEAKEAYRRQTCTSSSPPPAFDLEAAPKLREQASQTTVIFGHKRPGANLAPPAEAISAECAPERDAVSTPGIRARRQDARWKAPGGIAARFSLSSENSSAQKAQTPQDDTAEPLPEVKDAGVTSNESAQNQQPELTEQETSTPITIELQSH